MPVWDPPQDPRCNVVLLPPNPGSTEPCSTAVQSWLSLVEINTWLKTWSSLVERQPLVETPRMLLVDFNQVEFNQLNQNLNSPKHSYGGHTHAPETIHLNDNAQAAQNQ